MTAMTKEGVPEKNVLNAKLLGLSADSAREIRAKIGELNAQFAVLQETKIERMYIKDLDELEGILKKREVEFEKELKDQKEKMAKQMARVKK